MDNSKDDIIKISGSIGMTKLVGENKNVLIFYDDHSNTLYCNDDKSMFLYEIFEFIIKPNSDYIILLEEPFIKNYLNIKFLWNETPHIVKFRKFYKKVISNCGLTKICNVFPIDIRLIICDISIDELIANIDSDKYFINYNINVLEYFKHLLYLFDYIEWDNKLFENSDDNLKFLKKVFNKFKNNKYYKNLKLVFNKFYNNFLKNELNTEIKNFLKKNNSINYEYLKGFPFENNNENIFLNQYDKIINGIMEFYTFILLSGMISKNIIIYSGYYHSNNLSYILKKYYNYKSEYEIGIIDEIEKKEKKDKQLSNCLYIDKKIF